MFAASELRRGRSRAGLVNLRAALLEKPMTIDPGDGDMRRHLGSSAEDEDLKRDPWRAYCLACEMGDMTADSNPQGYYWRLAAYAYNAAHDRLERRQRYLVATLAVVMVVVFGLVVLRSAHS